MHLVDSKFIHFVRKGPSNPEKVRCFEYSKKSAKIVARTLVKRGYGRQIAPRMIRLLRTLCHSAIRGFRFAPHAFHNAEQCESRLTRPIDSSEVPPAEL